MARRSDRVGKRKPRTTVLVMCEGESEKVYFDRLGLLTESYSIQTKVCKDKRPEDIVDACAAEGRRRGLLKSDIMVAVFDLDSVEEDEIAGIVSLAEKRRVTLAVSNLSFEAWLILHIGSLSRLETQDDYERELTELLGRRYSKSVGLKDMVTAESVRMAIGEASRRLPDCDPVACKRTANSTSVWMIASRLLDERSRIALS